MKNLRNLGKALTRNEQANIKGSLGPTDFYLYCSEDGINYTVIGGPWTSNSDCHIYGLNNVCGVSCNFSYCSGDRFPCA